MIGKSLGSPGCMNTTFSQDAILIAIAWFQKHSDLNDVHMMVATEFTDKDSMCDNMAAQNFDHYYLFMA